MRTAFDAIASARLGDFLPPVSGIAPSVAARNDGESFLRPRRYQQHIDLRSRTSFVDEHPSAEVNAENPEHGAGSDGTENTVTAATIPHSLSATSSRDDFIFAGAPELHAKPELEVDPELLRGSNDDHQQDQQLSNYIDGLNRSLDADDVDADDADDMQVGAFKLAVASGSHVPKSVGAMPLETQKLPHFMTGPHDIDHTDVKQQIEQLSNYIDEVDGSMDIEERNAAHQTDDLHTDGSILRHTSTFGGHDEPGKDRMMDDIKELVTMRNQKADDEATKFLDLMTKLEHDAPELTNTAMPTAPIDVNVAAATSAHTSTQPEHLDVTTSGLHVDLSALNALKATVLVTGGVFSKMLGLVFLSYVAFQSIHTKYLKKREPSHENEEHFSLDKDGTERLGNVYYYQPPQSNGNNNNHNIGTCARGNGPNRM